MRDFSFDDIRQHFEAFFANERNELNVASSSDGSNPSYGSDGSEDVTFIPNDDY